MSSSQAPVPITTLLAHREWVRRLARSLVHDEASADDIEQRTWLTALARPPRQEGSARAWLARVVRSQAVDAVRARSRRAAHEQTGARSESVRSAAEVVAEAETHRRLVDAVLALDEPYRSTVLMRFFEDLPPRVVAERMAVPVETVRTRLRRALERLRERLGKEVGGDAWIAAIAPIAGMRLHACAGTSSATAAGVAGGTVMGAKATFAAAVGLVLVGGFAGGRLSAAAASARSDARVADLAQRVDSLQPHAAATDARPQPDRRRAALDERQAARDVRLDALEADLAAAVASAAKRPADAELDRLAAVGTPELLVEAKRLVKVAKYTKAIADAEAVLRTCGLLLARPLEADQRAETLILRGQGHAVLGDDAAEEASFREAMAVAGAASEQTENAMIGLAFAAGRRGDSSAAAQWSLRLADWHVSAARQAAAAAERAHHGYYAAVYLARASETARAREAYRAVVNEFGASDDKDVRKWADFSRKELAKLDGAAEKPDPNAPPPGRTNRAR